MRRIRSDAEEAMRIVFEGFRQTPSWVTLEKTICEALSSDSETAGRLVGICRPDNAVDYRSPGNYVLQYRNAAGDVSRIDFVVAAVVVPANY